MSNPNCTDCIWSDNVAIGHSREEMLICRYNPPQTFMSPSGKIVTRFPAVSKTDRCRHHETEDYGQ